MMKKSLILAMAMALGVTASAYAANPFSDVPAGHWAYDSVNQLAAAGVVDGYGDATFGGDKLMTRYEMAQIVARAMAKGANVDKLAAEFADELDSLGVRVANLEKKADNVRVTGEVKYRYRDYSGDHEKSKNEYKNKMRTRIYVNGQINEDWSYTGMLENTQDLKNNNGDERTELPRAYVNGKLGGLKVQAGRYKFTDTFDGWIYDDLMDGAQISYGKDLKLTLGAGKGSNEDEISEDPSACDTMYYGELGAKVGVVKVKAGYYKFDECAADFTEKIKVDGKKKEFARDNKVWAVGFKAPIAKDLKLHANYLKSDLDMQTYNGDDDGYVVGLQYKGAKSKKAGSWGVWANYFDQGYGTYVTHTMDAKDPGMKVEREGFKGYEIGAEYAFAKNIVGAVKYYDLESKVGDVDQKTIYSELVFKF